MRPPQHFFTALDFSKLPGRWVLTVPQRGGPGGAQRPPGATGLLANPWSVVLGLQINKIVC